MLGKKLRDLRDKAGFKATEVARRLEISTGRLSRIENGEVAPDMPLAKYLLDLYGIPVNDWEPWLEEVRAARKAKGWWQAYGVAARGYTALETAATSVRTFEIAHMPGLLQTEAYTQAFFRHRYSDKQFIENQVRVRMIRQQRLHAADDGLELGCVIDESVLTRQVGSSAIMKGQLSQMIAVAALPNVTVQVVPRDLSPYIGMDGAFTVLSFSGQPDLAYIENVAGSFQVEKNEQVQACRLAFDEIRSVALDPAASAALIRRMERSL
jgi:transcriptional regulator with XRE-family HTH domain